VREQGFAREYARRERRQQKHAPTFERKPDQEAQADEDANESDEIGKSH
jgi:hypothetical protein